MLERLYAHPELCRKDTPPSPHHAGLFLRQAAIGAAGRPRLAFRCWLWCLFVFPLAGIKRRLVDGMDRWVSYDSDHDRRPPHKVWGADPNWCGEAREKLAQKAHRAGRGFFDTPY